MYIPALMESLCIFHEPVYYKKKELVLLLTSALSFLQCCDWLVSQPAVLSGGF